MATQGTLLDTGFLISLVDPSRPGHRNARAYYEHALTRRIHMYLPALVMAEFAVRQSITDLPMENFIPASFNPGDAALAGRLVAERYAQHGDTRDGAKVDLYLLAQAQRLRVPSVLSEDRRTLKRHCDHFRDKGLLDCHVVLMADGFVAGRILDPATQDLF